MPGGYVTLWMLGVPTYSVSQLKNLEKVIAGKSAYGSTHVVSVGTKRESSCLAPVRRPLFHPLVKRWKYQQCQQGGSYQPANYDRR